MLQKKYRLTKRGSFSYVYKSGRTQGCTSLKLYFIRSSSLKIGFSVSNKIGKAVRRNRIKRLLRAAIRSIIPQINGKYQMVFIAKSPIIELDFAGIKKECKYLLHRANALNDMGNDSMR